MPNALTYLCLQADTAGLSHFTTVQVDVFPRDFAPPAPPFSVSAMTPATQLGFLQVPAGWVGDLHPSPLRMWVFVLSGRMEFEAGDGDCRQVAAGSALLLEDTTGSGHRSRVISHEAATLAIVHV